MATLKSPAKKKAPLKDSVPTEKSVDVVIDYPQESEVINPGCYVIRISSNSENPVEVSINKGPWQECRSAVGYYWFDWAAIPGEIVISARTKIAPNKWKQCNARKASVAGAEKN